MATVRTLARRTLALSRNASSARCRLVSTGTAQKGMPSVVTSPVPALDLPSGNIFTHVMGDMSSWENKTATECGVTGRRYTYSDMTDRAARWAGVLTKLGLKKGDVIAVVLPNCPEYPIMFLGAVSIGLVIAPINLTYTAEELHKLLVQCEAKMLISDPLLEPNVKVALSLYNRPTHVVMNGPSTIPGALNFREIVEDSSLPFAEPCELSGDEIAAMPFSSGTTGPPKGVALSHNAILSNVIMLAHNNFYATPETTGTYQASFLGILPFFHVSGILPLLLAFYKGLRMVYVPKFDPATFVKTISDYQIETLHFVPTLLNFLLHSPSSTPAALSSVSTIVCGAAPLAPSAVHAFLEKLQRPIFVQELYGMTEILVSMMTPTSARKVGTCGVTLPGVSAKIVDTVSGETLSANQNGEIWVKTPTMMSGYYKNPSATAETIDSDGWLHTGDVGHYDDEGFFKIVDRTKELIKVKGLQVSPSELEDLILQHPGVVEVGVVGVPDERLGEAPRAYVVTSGKVSGQEIQQFLDSRVAPHKKLVGGVVLMDALPKNTVGKLLRRELRDMAARDN